MFAPARTPKYFVTRRNRELNAVLRRADARELLEREDIVPLYARGQHLLQCKRVIKLQGREDSRPSA